MNIKSLLQTKFLKYFIEISKGTLLAHLISAITPFILINFFSPPEIGLLAFFTSIISVVSSFAGLDYYSAINVTDKKESIYPLFYLSCILSTSLVSLVFLVSVILFLSLDSFPSKLSSLSALALYPWALFFSLHLPLNELLARKKLFGQLGKNHLMRSSFSSLLQVTAGFLGYGVIGLLTGRVMGEAIAFISTFRKLPTSSNPFCFVQIKKTFKVFKSYSLNITPIRVVLSLSKNSPIFILTSFYTLQDAGLFAIASKAVNLSSGIISENIQKVYESRSNSYLVSELKGFHLKALVFSMIIAIGISVPFALLYLGSDQVPLKEEWRTALTFLPALLPLVFCNLLNALNYSTLKRLGELKWLRNFITLQNTTVFSSILTAAILRFSIKDLVLTYSLTSLLWALGKTLLTLKKLPS